MPAEGESFPTDPVLVWGAGAIGGTIGAFLARGGYHVRLVDVAEDHVAAVRSRGLEITGPVARFTVDVDATPPDALEGSWPVILLCVKAHHTASAARALRPHLDERGVVVSVQNGLNESVIASVVGPERTFGCFVNFGADYTGPGRVHYGGRGALVLGELDGRRTERAERLLALFRSFDPDAVLSDNVWGYLWSKLAYASMLFATALSREGIADALDRPEHRDLYRALAAEVVAVAHARGVRLEAFDGFEPEAFARSAPPELAERSLRRLVAHNRRSAKTHSGIWRDLAVRGRPTEVDAQLGVVVEHGDEVGVPMPLNRRLVAMIHEVERGARPQAVANLDALAARER